MKDVPFEFDENSPVEIAASEWFARLDRGLTADEQDRYVEWLAKDPLHRETINRYQSDWENFDRLAGIHLKSHARIDPDLLAPAREQGSRWARWGRNLAIFGPLPFAAIVVLTLFFVFSGPEESAGLKLQPATELLARIEQKTLADGSIIEMNRGAEVEVAYTAAERRVFLKKGEANFDVAKDPDRPFLVNVAGVDVQAVGTIFSIRLQEDEVDVIVTEGVVKVKPSNSAPAAPQGAVSDTFLQVGQRAKVDIGSAAPVINVSAIDDREVQERHLWKPRLLDYDKILLGEIVKEFNRSNPVKVVLSDPSLETISLSSTFWSDNVEGFVRLMESSFGMEAEWRGSREILLRKAR